MIRMVQEKLGGVFSEDACMMCASEDVTVSTMMQKFRK